MSSTLPSLSFLKKKCTIGTVSTGKLFSYKAICFCNSECFFSKIGICSYNDFLTDSRSHSIIAFRAFLCFLSFSDKAFLRNFKLTVSFSDSLILETLFAIFLIFHLFEVFGIRQPLNPQYTPYLPSFFTSFFLCTIAHIVSVHFS